MAVRFRRKESALMIFAGNECRTSLSKLVEILKVMRDIRRIPFPFPLPLRCVKGESPRGDRGLIHLPRRLKFGRLSGITGRTIVFRAPEILGML